MSAAGLRLDEDVRGTIGAIVAVAVTVPDQPAITGAEQIATVKEHPLGPGCGTVDELPHIVGAAVAILVDQDADIPGPGDDDPPARVDRHRIDVMSQLIASEQRDFKSFRNTHAQFGVGLRSHSGRENR